MDLSGLNDFELWDALKSGERDAYSLVYFRYFGKLYEYGLRIIDDEELVKDQIHDLFVRIWVKRNGLPEVSHVKAYLISALRNSINQYQRTSKNRIRIATDYAGTQLNEFSLELDYIQKEDLDNRTKQLLAAMDKLTAKQKEVMYLRYFEDIDYDEIARIMGVDIKSIYKLNARALEHLRVIFDISKSGLLLLLLSAQADWLRS